MLGKVTPATWRAKLAAHRLIVITLIAGLTLGVWLGNDYGITFDEQRNTNVGAAALRAYAGAEDYFELGSLADHGPVYFMIFSASSRAIHTIFPSWTEADGRHLTHFIAFLAAVLCFYLLCLRLMRPTSAWMATVLFSTQPLLFGHGFINQKDTPFMVFFLATFVTGLAAADRMAGQQQERLGLSIQRVKLTWQAFMARVTEDWRQLSTSKRAILTIVALLGLFLAFDLLFLGMLRDLGRATVAAAYDGRAPAPVQQLYEGIATDAHKTPLNLYLAKYEAYYQQLRLPLVGLVALASLVGGSLGLSSLARSLGFSRRSSLQPMLLGSAVLLGAAICVRQLGVFVGGLVSLYALYRRGTKAFFPLVVYWLVAAFVTYLTWPYLWPDPVGRFVDSIFLAATFPAHRTFFEGRWISSSILPWYYFPTLAGLELTEPAVLLTLLGAVVAAWRLPRQKTHWSLYALLGLWAGVPLAGLVLFDMTIYGNIRHLLFILPPFLVAAGLGLDAITSRLRPRWAGWLAFLIVVTPGIWGIIRLHPYEYVYMNSFIGGVSGAYGRYELDRQCISLREAIEVVNGIAEPGATVMVLRQTSQVIPYARSDLNLIDDRQSPAVASFVLACRWPDRVDLTAEGFQRIYQVRRGQAVLTDVWQIEATE